MRRKVEEKYECRFLLQVCLVCERSLTLCKWPDARCYYDYNTKHPAAQEGSQASDSYFEKESVQNMPITGLSTLSIGKEF